MPAPDLLVTGGDHVVPNPGELTLAQIEPVIRAAWALDTCDEVDVAEWSPHNPARGQCGVTALVLRELLGGDLLLAQVHFRDGGYQGVHYWNRLPTGEDVDLTREQFGPEEIVGVAEVVDPPPGLPSRGTWQYLRLRDRVRRVLAIPGSLVDSPRLTGALVDEPSVDRDIG